MHNETHKIAVHCPIADGFEVSSVRGMFDLAESPIAEQRFNVELPADEDWKIGVIVGPSGSGKSTVAKHVYGDAVTQPFTWDTTRAVIAQLDGELKTATQMLSSVGFSSPPSWIKPYHVLSGGERFRCDLARALLEPGSLIVFDEFTSVVDRTVAQVGSAAIAKAIRKNFVQKRFVAVTCHYDVIEWLEPDWVLDMASCQLARGCLWQRPAMEIQVHRVTRDAWPRFRRHHYLDGSIYAAAKCFAGFYEHQPIAFVAVIHFPHATGAYWREHRTVVLPDYQGLGIGNKLSELVASAFAATGRRYFASTLHPAHTHHRAKSPWWIMTQKPSRRKKGSRGKRIGVGATSATTRMIASFRYVGQPDLQLAKIWGLV